MNSAEYKVHPETTAPTQNDPGTGGEGGGNRDAATLEPAGERSSTERSPQHISQDGEGAALPDGEATKNKVVRAKRRYFGLRKTKDERRAQKAGYQRSWRAKQAKRRALYRARKEKARQWRREKITGMTTEEYEAHLAKRREQAKKYYKHSPTVTKVSSIAYARAYPERVAAHQEVYKAVRDGRLHKPTECSECGRAARLHAHHTDYSKPLEIIWLCCSCHSRKHPQKKRGGWSQQKKSYWAHLVGALKAELEASNAK